MATIPSDARMLIAVRVIVVTTLLLAALIIQYTFYSSATEGPGIEVLPIDYVYAISGLAYVFTLIYIAAGRFIVSRDINLMVQIAGDLVLETLLVYFTGGLDSPFSFLYLVSIITASMMLYRRGGLLAAAGASILYGALVDLMYYRVFPMPEQSIFTLTDWTRSEERRVGKECRSRS